MHSSFLSQRRHIMVKDLEISIPYLRRIFYMAMMKEAVIVDALRTPVGRRKGQLKEWHPVDLMAQVLRKIVERNGIDSACIDDVILGCASQFREQSRNIARNAALAANFPVTVPGTTIDRRCGSSQQAIHFAAQGIMSGNYEVVIAGGVESMTKVPLDAPMDGDMLSPYGSLLLAQYDRALVSQGLAAERIAQKWNLRGKNWIPSVWKAIDEQQKRPLRVTLLLTCYLFVFKTKMAQLWIWRKMREYVRTPAWKSWRNSSQLFRVMDSLPPETHHRLAMGLPPWY